jgi:5-methylcytosine-specific restriction endonuclease McrA
MALPFGWVGRVGGIRFLPAERPLIMPAEILQQPTLVLNRNWQPVHVATVARALVLLWNHRALVVDPEDFQTYTWEHWSKLQPREGEKFIQAVTIRLRVPEVVTLPHYDRVPDTYVTFSRRNLFKRDHNTCQYCGAQPGTEELTIDHVIPRSQGGPTSWTNCVVACVACNKKKGDRTPQQAGMKLRRQPFRPTWRPIYVWKEMRIKSWSKFLSEVYWNVELEQ